MAPEMRAAVKAVASHFPTAIISGRGLDKVTAFVQLGELYYAGSHGFDIQGPTEGPRAASAPVVHQPVPWACDMMDAVHDALVAGVAGIPGAAVEHNKFCVSVHYRLCPDRWPEVEEIIATALEAYPRLKVTRGRKVFEVRPQVEWDKGRAVLFLLDALGLPRDPSRVAGVYLGDDVSDEDAFRTLAEEGLGTGILVASRAKTTAARYTLRSPDEVREFMTRLVALGEAKRAAAAAG